MTHKTYMDALLNGEVEINDIDRFTFGMTNSEYSLYVENPDVLPLIIEVHELDKIVKRYEATIADIRKELMVVKQACAKMQEGLKQLAYEKAVAELQSLDAERSSNV